MFDSILLPIDLSSADSWSKALPAALRLVRETDGTLHVLSVIPDFGMSVVGSFFEDDFEKKALDKVGRELSSWVKTHVPDGIDVHPHVTHGRIYDQIMQAANSLNVDTIVIGAHSPGLNDYLLGTNAARVVRHAAQSVFVIRGR